MTGAKERLNNLILEAETKIKTMYPHERTEGKSKYGKQYKFITQHFQEAYNRYRESVSPNIP